MAACSCKNKKTKRIAVSCLNRCGLPKHRCLLKEDIGPGKIPSCMGWLYTAKDSPDHQLRCGWHPGHISCSVLQRMAEDACFVRCGKCYSCLYGRPCSRPCGQPSRCKPSQSLPCAPRSCMACPPRRCIPCPRSPRCHPALCTPRAQCRRPKYYCTPAPIPACYPPKCSQMCMPAPCPPCPSGDKCIPVLCTPKPKCYPSSPGCPPKTKCFIATYPPRPSYQPCETPYHKPMVRIVRHNGKYNIITKPDDITNHSLGPYPLKYVIDSDELSYDKYSKYSIEAKYNDQTFDYTPSKSSFVLDFSPPDEKCTKPCPTRSSVCYPCQKPDVPIEEHQGIDPRWDSGSSVEQKASAEQLPYAPIIVLHNSTEHEHAHGHKHEHPPGTAHISVEQHAPAPVVADKNKRIQKRKNLKY